MNAIKDKKILFIDDDLSLLQSFEKYCNKLIPNNNFQYIDRYDFDYITDDLDIIVSDFYLGRGQHVPDLIRGIKLEYPELFIMVVSGALVTNDGKYTCYNTNLYNESLKAGANNVIAKDIVSIMDTINMHFQVRTTKKSSLKR